MKMRLLTGLLIGFFLVSIAGTAGASIIQNGNFDDDLSGWTIVGPVTPENGAAMVGKPGPNDDSSISQMFDIFSGATAINISFDYSWFGNNDTTEDDIFTVTFSYLNQSNTWEDMVLLQETNNNDYNSSTTIFDEMIGLSSLSLNDVPDNGKIMFNLIESNSDETQGTGIELDNVTVNPVPEPATMILFGVGLLGIAGVSRRRNQ